MGISQLDCATKCGLSLAAIQKIESGHGNPSLKSLLRLVETLGVELSWKTKSVPWDTLIEFGLPLTEVGNSKKSKPPRPEHFAEVFRYACSEKVLESRHEEALQATVLAIESHYYNFFFKELKWHPGVQRLSKKAVTGRVVKLRRIALAGLSGYL